MKTFDFNKAIKQSNQEFLEALNDCLPLLILFVAVLVVAYLFCFFRKHD